VEAFIADKFLGELLGEISRRARKIFFLGIDQLAARIYDGQFISAMRRNRISSLPQRCRRTMCRYYSRAESETASFRRPRQAYSPVRLCDEAMHFLYLTTKPTRAFKSSSGSPTREYPFQLSEDAQGSLLVLCLHCVKESATGIFGS